MNTIANVDLKAGDIIIDDIACRVDSIVFCDSDGVCMMVEDGNGYWYTLTRAFEGFSRTLGWTEEQWTAYRAL